MTSASVQSYLNEKASHDRAEKCTLNFLSSAPRGSINHLGVETASAEEVVAAEARLTASGLQTTGVDDTICCFAEKVETWVESPEGHRWEWYVKQADHEDQLENVVINSRESTPCC